MLHLPIWQRSEAREPSEKIGSSRNRGAIDIRHSTFLVFKETTEKIRGSENRVLKGNFEIT